MSKATPPLIVFFLLSLSCSGWGPTGHRVTGWVAEKYLNKKARTVVQKLLHGQSLAIASTWMDEIRSDSAYDYMADWHWVTIPDGELYQATSKNPNGDVIQTLERLMNAIKAGKLTPEEQLSSLRILIHLIGDIHQPLHVGARPDRGGNEIQVMWFRNSSNLHRIWDSDMIDDTRLSYTELAQSLETPSGEQIHAWQNSSVYDWARESQSYQNQVYKYGNGKLGYDYAYINYPIVRSRLLKAGVRLAGVLNELYG
jgi:hypothetical protein